MVTRLGGCPELDRRLKRRQRRSIQAFRRYWEEQFASPESWLRWMASLSRIVHRPTPSEPKTKKSDAHTLSRDVKILHPRAAVA